MIGQSKTSASALEHAQSMLQDAKTYKSSFDKNLNDNLLCCIINRENLIARKDDCYDW